ncbi:hypothetical protein M422DRAFT_781835 [Sphaerobolus stellatus SS14]|uniref:Unplaced genomic scaffold SPHSTscaffold_95, whole genome shotgun sequence n=1 Tax=Sphaerobolus stellatus (strain SS14) TaxID=990650 RepID=A0A0C9U331_SPHS4|nr:hypothetical protein M422DRAFT_781835 [Sphaerobolus stellatus SS14]
MSTIHGFTIAISILNLIGSLSSFLGAGFILACYLLLPMKRHFRHVLILNLAAADCLNGLDNSVSGFYILLKRRSISPGHLCTASGFIGQLTVQGSDCAILAIALITVSTITSKNNINTVASCWSAKVILYVTAAIWALPVFTSVFALGMQWYSPATGSWCWLVENPKYIRYVLTHGWRFLFIAIEIGLYTYLHFYLSKHYRNLAQLVESQRATEDKYQSTGNSTGELNKVDSKPPSSQFSAVSEKGNVTPSPSNSAVTIPQRQVKRRWIFSHRNKRGGIERQHPRYKSIQRVLLLNAYPLAYIILWIPGIINRLIEASGHTSTVTQVLQASTQFVGLANALTYGWNEGIATRLKERYFPRGQHHSQTTV